VAALSRDGRSGHEASRGAPLQNANGAWTGCGHVQSHGVMEGLSVSTRVDLTESSPAWPHNNQKKMLAAQPGMNPINLDAACISLD